MYIPLIFIGIYRHNNTNTKKLKKYFEATSAQSLGVDLRVVYNDTRAQNFVFFLTGIRVRIAHNLSTLCLALKVVAMLNHFIESEWDIWFFDVELLRIHYMCARERERNKSRHSEVQAAPKKNAIGRWNGCADCRDISTSYFFLSFYVRPEVRVYG